MAKEVAKVDRGQAITPTPIKTARVVRNVSAQNQAKGTQLLVRVNPPMENELGKHEYVVASSVAAFTGYETLIFPSNESGEVVDYGELAGRRGVEYDEVFEDQGYIIVTDEVTQ